MRERPERHYTVSEYYAIEQSAEIKHEYYNGEIFAMAGASLNHNRIVRNALFALGEVLAHTECEVLGSDLRVYAPSGLYTYPDAMVICGRPALVDGAPLDTVTNPALIVEVLSDSTQDYDRGEKFTLYGSIPSLHEYWLIAQKEARVERFERKADGSWRSGTFADFGGHVPVGVVGGKVPLTALYDGVFAASG